MKVNLFEMYLSQHANERHGFRNQLDGCTREDFLEECNERSAWNRRRASHLLAFSESITHNDVYLTERYEARSKYLLDDYIHLIERKSICIFLGKCGVWHPLEVSII
ncbi:unnamed protein product [Albugo candida]|uniref:Uncharacterized protein n=1 Tax=Albugo candida TaxID=65357 RepID=A0A024G9N5_9STRA|nr:unnamed protein product [Albugo candida]|eukprot:CCI43032.1 unnamed protein product [Albugo candida]